MNEALLICLAVIGALFAIRRGVPGFFCSRGYAHKDRGDYGTAEQWFLRAACWEDRIRQITGKQRGLAIVYTALGHLYHLQSRPMEAVAMLKEAMRIFLSLGRTDELVARNR